MKQTIIIKSLLIATASLLGFAATVRAQDPAHQLCLQSGSLGLLGQTYAGLDYSYIDFHHSPTNADAFGFQYNQSLNAGLDGLLTYDWSQTGVVLGERAKQQTIAWRTACIFSTFLLVGQALRRGGRGLDVDEICRQPRQLIHL